MKKFLTAGIILLLLLTHAEAQQRVFDFQTASPESLKINPALLQEHADELFRRGTQVYIVIHDGKIIHEQYAPDWTRYTNHYTASAAKGVMGGLSLMLAMHDGLIALDDPAHKYIPQWKDDPFKSKITVRQLGAHSSGLDDSTERGANQNTLPGWKGDFWRQERNPFILSRDEARVLFTPGSDFQYSNPGIGMLNYAVTVAIKDAEHNDIRTYLWERLIKKMDIPRGEWSVGYGKTFEEEGLKLVATWGGGSASGRSMAAVGLLLSNKGNWNGEQLISAQVVDEVLTLSEKTYQCSGGFWLNSHADGKARWAALPQDTAMASGAQDQIMLFSPTRKLIVVRFGSSNIEQGNYAENVVNKYIGIPLMKAMGDSAPYPRSEKITEVHWAPVDTIERRAAGSDNFPITWGKDDNLYTAFGDGFGFEPLLPLKLGLGFGKITGELGNLSSETIRSNAENQGQGGAGQKASGLLAIEDSIYMWVRNADLNGKQSRLAQSDDQQKTWNWCDWRFEEFGHIAFVNYGKNYQGARDDYVYMVTHDNASAYVFADHFVLMRAPKTQLMDRETYEFYRGTDDSGKPLWTKDVRQRQPVFSNPQKCRRSSVSYNAGLGKYLWVQLVPRGSDVDTRFRGGLGIFEASEPWGPWKTVYYSEPWDVGPGDLACFPTKWMSADGKTLYLVFSGDDNFSLRKVTLTVSEE